MKILKEGTIRITPDSDILATDFHVEGGSFSDLEALVRERVLRAALKAAAQTWSLEVAAQMGDPKLP